MKPTVLRLAVMFTYLWLSSGFAGAQVSATLSGRVTDSSGGAVAHRNVANSCYEPGGSI
jgi:hypothetical protein